MKLMLERFAELDIPCKDTGSAVWGFRQAEEKLEIRDTRIRMELSKCCVRLETIREGDLEKVVKKLDEIQAELKGGLK